MSLNIWHGVVLGGGGGKELWEKSKRNTEEINNLLEYTKSH